MSRGEMRPATVWRIGSSSVEGDLLRWCDGNGRPDSLESALRAGLRCDGAAARGCCSSNRTCALFGGADGLDVIRRLLNEGAAHLAPGGRLIVEFGFGQDGAIRQLAAEAGWNVIHIREDLQGIPRTAVLSRPVATPAE